MARKTLSINLDGAANALEINKDANLVAVAGRSVFKIFEIGEDSMKEHLNMRVGKNLNLNFSCNDISWNCFDENVLATAATNGSVVLWNLQKQSRSKLDVVFNDHKRTVNKVCFHPTEANLLLSGSQDGTMKLFDMRKKEAVSTFISNSQSVRDVQFSPGANYYFHFAAVQETGNVEIWDYRNPSRPEGNFFAHNGPVFSCDWHPSGKKKKWLATAGRDKTIKVWDLSIGTIKPQLLYCIQTMASVSRVQWRPNKEYQIGSCSLVVDFGIYVWDVKRPYVPSAIFMEHKDVTTGFAWKNDPHVILSTSKDGTLYQHVYDDAFRPSDHYNPIGLTLDPIGNVTLAASDNILKNSVTSTSIVPKELVKSHSIGPNSVISSSGIINLVTPNTKVNQLTNLFRKSTDLTEQFRNAVSSLLMFDSACNEETNSAIQVLSMDWFVISAKEYQLDGKPLIELCEHNARVAEKLNRIQVAQTWRLLLQMYNLSGRGTTLSGGNATVMSNVGLINDVNERSEATNPSRHTSGGTASRHLSGNKTISKEVHIQPQNIEVNCGNDDSDSSIVESNLFGSRSKPLSSGDVFFPYSDPLSQSGYQLNNDVFTNDAFFTNTDWELPREAFVYRHSIADCGILPEFDNDNDTPNDPASPTSDDDDDCDDEHGEDVSHNHVGFNVSRENDSSVNTFLSSKTPSAPAWPFADLVSQMLIHYASQGDVQTAVSILLVVGDKVKSSPLIDSSTQLSWYQSYIDLLSRFQLWNVMTLVIRLSPLTSINQMHHTSTVMHTMCGICGKPLVGRVGYVCDKCKRDPSNCAVCHVSVSGLFVWCQGCSHGGHLSHIQRWFQSNKLCPAGCGHQCEYC